MTRKEIEEEAEKTIEEQCEESGCIREEVLVPSMHHFVAQYLHGQISKFDLIQFSKYFGVFLDMKSVEELKEKVKRNQA